MSDLKDFVIEDGVLKKYLGEGGDVVIPDGVKTMYKNIFYNNTNITSIIIPDSAVEIGVEVFSGCKNLTNVIIPKSVVKIRDYAFKNCSALESIVFPENLEIIGDYAFDGCSNLKSVIIPQNVKIIGRNAFKGCINIESLQIPDSIESIGSGAFLGCNLLADENGFIIIKDVLCQAPDDCEELIIPDNVSTIDIFIGYKSLKRLTLPSSVTNINLGALHDSFWGNGCENLEEIIIKGDITSFDGSCLKDLCRELYDTNVKLVLLYALLKYVPKIVLEDKAINKKIKANKKVIVEYLSKKDDSETIEKLFSLFKKIELDELNEFIEKAENCATVKAFLLNYKEQFYPIKKQERIENIKIEKELGLKEFSVADWKKIFALESDEKGIIITGYKGEDTDVIIPEKIGGKNVVKIGPEAFSPKKGKLSKQIQENLLKIISIRIPDTVKTIEPRVFNGCKNLVYVKLPSKLSAIESSVFSECRKLANIDIPDTVKTIGESAFSDCETLAKIKLPQKLTKIGNWAFSNCLNLESIEISKKIKYIKSGAFHRCVRLTSFTIPEDVTTIEAQVFHDCESLSSVIIHDKITAIKEFAFNGCKKLEYKKIPDTVKTIDDTAFQGCVNYADQKGFIIIRDVLCDYLGEAENVIIPENITAIAYGAFKKNDSLVSVYVPKSITSLTEGTFSNCENLKSVIIDAKIKTIPRSAFCDCKSLIDFTIPDNVTKIDDYAFFNCEKLEKIHISEKVKTFGYLPFKKCTNLTIYAPAGSASEKYAQKWNIPFVAE